MILAVVEDCKATFFESIRDSNETLLEEVLASGGDVNCRDEVTGERPLHWSARFGRFWETQWLIGLGARPNVVNKVGKTPLHMAAETGASDLIKVLVDNGAAVIAFDTVWKTPLWYALRGAHFETAVQLLEFGGPCSDSDEDLIDEDGPPLVVMLKKDQLGRTLLHHAVLHSNPSCVKLFVKMSRGHFSADEIGFTPLHFSTMRGKDRITELLLESGNGGGIAVHDKLLKFTPLHWVSGFGFLNLVELLVGHQAPIDEVDEAGSTPLHWAAATCQSLTAAALLRAGARSDIVNQVGRTPLHDAAKQGCFGTTQVLAEVSEVDALDQDGRTPAWLAVQRAAREPLRILLNAGAGVESADKEGNTLLLAAASTRSTELVVYLLARGADYKHVNKGRESFLERLHNDTLKDALAGKETWDVIHWVALSCDVESGKLAWEKGLLEGHEEELPRVLEITWPKFPDRLTLGLADIGDCESMGALIQQQIDEGQARKRAALVAYQLLVLAGLFIDLAALGTVMRACGHVQVMEIEDGTYFYSMFTPLCVLLLGAVETMWQANKLEESLIPSVVLACAVLVLCIVLLLAKPGSSLAKQIVAWRVRGKQRSKRAWRLVEGCTWAMALLVTVMFPMIAREPLWFTLVICIIVGAACASKTVRWPAGRCWQLPLWAWLEVTAAVLVAVRTAALSRFSTVGHDHTMYHLIAWACFSDFVYCVLKHCKKLHFTLNAHEIEMAELEGSKFVTVTLVLGSSSVAASGLHRALGISAEDLAGYARGLEVMEAEIVAHGDADDVENFSYVAKGTGLKEEDLPAAVRESMRTGKYHGGEMRPEDYDTGHAGMTLADWMRTREVVVAGLTEAEFVALRFYTSSSFRKINNPLRHGVCPHPWKMTVLFLAEAVKKMRAVRAHEGDGFMNTISLWRGMKDMSLDIEAFKREGGTELAPMSTTNDPAVAMSYSRSKAPLVFKYNVGGLATGVCIQFCSLYPKEKEYLYPPLTHLTYRTDYTDNGLHIVEIEPVMA